MTDHRGLLSLAEEVRQPRRDVVAQDTHQFYSELSTADRCARNVEIARRTGRVLLCFHPDAAGVDPEIRDFARLCERAKRRQLLDRQAEALRQAGAR